jgi:hypothetical protein
MPARQTPGANGSNQQELLINRFSFRPTPIPVSNATSILLPPVTTAPTTSLQRFGNSSIDNLNNFYRQNNPLNNLNNPNNPNNPNNNRPQTSAGPRSTSTSSLQPLSHYNNNMFGSNQNNSGLQPISGSVERIFNPPSNASNSSNNSNSTNTLPIINGRPSTSASSSSSSSPSRGNNSSNNNTSDNDASLPGLPRADLMNSYNANPDVYMFLKAQEMGFQRERIREVMERDHPTSLNDLLRRLINHSTAAVSCIFLYCIFCIFIYYYSGCATSRTNSDFIINNTLCLSPRRLYQNGRTRYNTQSCSFL